MCSVRLLLLLLLLLLLPSRLHLVFPNTYIHRTHRHTDTHLRSAADDETQVTPTASPANHNFRTFCSGRSSQFRFHDDAAAAAQASARSRPRCIVVLRSTPRPKSNYAIARERAVVHVRHADYTSQKRDSGIQR